MHKQVVWAVALAVLVMAAAGCGGADQAAAENVARIQSIGDKEGGTEDEILFLVDRLENGNAEERSAAAFALGRAGSIDNVPSLALAIREDSDLYVRVNGIKALGRLGGDLSREVLLEQLGDPDEEIQAEALKAMGGERYAGDFEAVGALCQSDSAAIRSIAVDTLARMGNPEALAHVDGLTADPDKEVRNIVAFTMGKLGDPDTVPHLLPMLEDSEWEVRANAAQALGMIGDDSARAALEGLLDDPSEQVQFAAQRALDKLG